MNEFTRSVSRCGVAFLLGGWLAVPLTVAAPTESVLMPVPAEIHYGSGRLDPAPVRFAIIGHDDARLRAGLSRALRRAEERTGFTFARLPNGDYQLGAPTDYNVCLIDCGAAGQPIPALGEDESYTLEVDSKRVLLRAPTVLGALHGFETLLQLIQHDAGGWFLPEVRIRDQPRFPWRGLMIDVCRHWQPIDVIKRNLDGMALVKLNVLHLHLTDDQGFRIESRKFPRLHEAASDGRYFTQEEMRGLIEYATARGIRVVPEFDIPGHATSWVTAFPGLASAPGPYVLERRWGVFNPVLDPTNERVYEVLDGFLGEMAALFPDPCLHIGGDENNGVQWSGNPAIQAYIKEHRLKDNAGLHAYFNRRVQAILAKYGKQLIGWDEILHPDLPAGSVVHSWRGAQGVGEATARGFATILSHGYYIDLAHPAAQHYLNDPAPSSGRLSPAQRTLVLGGEATMWTEWVTPETIDSRIWPRTAAIAERLWSPETVTDVPDMYRRLDVVSRRLEETGLHHLRYGDPALRRLAGEQATDEDLRALRRFADLLEPVKNYQRGRQQPGSTQFTPLTGLVDCARPDSAPAREFTLAVERLASDPRSAEAAARVDAMLAGWGAAAEHLLARLPALSPRLAEAQPLLRDLGDAAASGRQVCAALREGRPLPDQAARQAADVIQRLGTPHAAAELPVGKALARLAGVRP